MTDVANHIPGPDLLAAREAFLQACIDAPVWNAPHKKPRGLSNEPPPIKQAQRKDILISMDHMRDAAREMVMQTSLKWRKELDLMHEMKLYAVETKTPLPNNYWVPEHNAHARYNVAMIVAEAFAP